MDITILFGFHNLIISISNFPTTIPQITKFKNLMISLAKTPHCCLVTISRELTVNQRRVPRDPPAGNRLSMNLNERCVDV